MPNLADGFAQEVEEGFLLVAIEGGAALEMKPLDAEPGEHCQLLCDLFIGATRRAAERVVGF